MKKLLPLIVTFVTLALCLTNTLRAEVSPVGIWKNIEDKGEHKGQAKAHMQIYEENGMYYAKIIKLLRAPQDSLCRNCKGAKYNMPVVGLVIMEKMKKVGDRYEGGEIMDPKSGNYYKCKFWMEDNNKIKLRGYLMFFFRTQYWFRVQ